MNVLEMKELIVLEAERLLEEYNLVGLRFENKEYKVGEECEYSRNNIDREDERDFPEYGTEEYEGMEIMDGTSSWDINSSVNNWLWSRPNSDCKKEFMGQHAYLIVGDYCGDEQLSGIIDDGELLIRDAVVAVKIY